MTTELDVVRPGAASARRLHNPVQRVTATFLETSAESSGERTLIEFTVAPGGRVPAHYHLSRAESLRVREGRLTVRRGDAHLDLGPGDEAAIRPPVVHGWSNRGEEPAVVEVELRPGHPGFETSLRVGYGLAADGHALPNGLPRKLMHTALLLAWAEAGLTGAYLLLAPVLRELAYLGRRLGVDQELERRYL